MSVYKDTKQGTWYVSFRYVDWTGEKKQKLKRGFRTKREALEYEAEFKRKASADMDMLSLPSPELIIEFAPRTVILSLPEPEVKFVPVPFNTTSSAPVPVVILESFPFTFK